MDDEQRFTLKIGSKFAVEVLTHGVYIRIGKREWFLERNTA
jgi:hypothetical protein